jgi:hypothetical protein
MVFVIRNNGGSDNPLTGWQARGKTPGNTKADDTTATARYEGSQRRRIAQATLDDRSAAGDTRLERKPGHCNNRPTELMLPPHRMERAPTLFQRSSSVKRIAITVGYPCHPS